MSNYILANNFTKQVLYQLDKFSSRLVDYYIRGAASQNVNTGRTTYPETKLTIKKAIVMNTAQARQLAQATNFAVAGRPFEYGGFFATNGLYIIIKYKDLAANFVQNTDDAFIIDHKRYNIKEVQNYQEMQSFIFVVEELVGQPVHEIFGSKDNLYLSENVSYEIGVTPPVAQYVYNSNRVIIRNGNRSPVTIG